MASTKTNGAFRDPFVDYDDIEAAQETARRGFKIVIGANHDLHPRNDADCFFGVALMKPVADAKREPLAIGRPGRLKGSAQPHGKPLGIVTMFGRIVDDATRRTVRLTA